MIGPIPPTYTWETRYKGEQTTGAVVTFSSHFQADHYYLPPNKDKMAGRVYICSFAAFVLVSTHVSAFVLPIHPRLLLGPTIVPVPALYNKQPARLKPLTRPFTLADAAGGFGVHGGFDGGFGGASFPVGGGFDGGFDLGFGNDLSFGGNDFGINALSNDLNSVSQQGVAGLRDISDSTIIGGGPIGPLNSGFGYSSDISDSTILVGNGGQVGQLNSGFRGEDSTILLNSGGQVGQLTSGFGTDLSDSAILVGNGGGVGQF